MGAERRVLRSVRGRLYGFGVQARGAWRLAGLHVICLLAVVSFAAQSLGPALADQPPTPDAASAPEQAGPGDIPRSTNRDRDINARIDALEHELEVRDNALGIVVNILWFAGAFGVIISVVVGIVYYFQNERNRRRDEVLVERQRILDEGYTRLNSSMTELIQVSKNQSQQVFDETLGKATTTLDLINSLLSVTDRAAKRAEGAQRGFLKTQNDEIAKKCKVLVENARNEDQDRAIISLPWYRDEILSLSNEISTLKFQIGSFNSVIEGTPDEQLQLSALAQFVQGLRHYIDQNFDDSLECWEQASKSSDYDETKFEVYYWSAIRYNNLGMFERAIRDFRRAQGVAETLYKEESNVRMLRYAHDLDRLLLESDFFQTPLQDAGKISEIYERLEGQYNTLPLSFGGKLRALYSITLGNISFALGLTNQFVVKDTRAVDTWLPRAEQWFRGAQEHDRGIKWGDFSLCHLVQVSFLFNEPTDEQLVYFRETLETRVIPEAIQEFERRIEPRTKVLAKVSEYLARLWLHDPTTRSGTATEAIRDLQPVIWEQFAQVNRNLTLYSQFQKRNVRHEVFEAELRVLFAENNMMPLYEHIYRSSGPAA